jgi:hypothetical protein
MGCVELGVWSGVSERASCGIMEGLICEVVEV